MKNRFDIDLPVSELYLQCPYLSDFFLSLALTPPPLDTSCSLREWFEDIEYCTLDAVAVDRAELPEQFSLFIQSMIQQGAVDAGDIESITIIGGFNKDREPEDLELTLKKGDVVSLVGPTGSGKSRLLADIEWLAQGDTPTGRRILVNGAVPPASWRFTTARKLVAQLSQNMNFVMDISASDFITMHCESRLIKNAAEKKAQILEAANRLAGEPILEDMQVTGLSGGQSRALMIADTAYLSASPIVLIDEIENAGINRKQAIELLIRAEKIVVIATHDPVLALSADRRIVIRNGGIAKVMKTSPAEKEKLIEIDRINELLMGCREKLRAGEEIR